MTTGSWAIEREAYQSFNDLITQADHCRALFERANIVLPEPLKRFLGVSGQAQQRALIPAPERSFPPGAAPDWISVELRHATATSLVFAVLRSSSEPLRAKDVVSRVNEIRPEISGGSIANIGSRLNGQKLRREEGVWRLIRPEDGAVIYHGRLWGPHSIFDKYEVASHRREALMYLLKHFQGGLQALQIVEQLQNLPWVHAPINKDLVKEDLNALAEDRLIRRRGNTRKWEATPDLEKRKQKED
jgi:hypothetical protein